MPQYLALQNRLCTFGFGMDFLLLQEGVMKDFLKHSSSRVALGLALPTVVGQQCDIYLHLLIES